MERDISSLLSEITAALEAVAEPGFKEKQQHYSKEAINSIGVRTPMVRKIGKEFYPRVKPLPIDELLVVCRAVLEMRTVEHRNIAFAWAFRRKKDLLPSHFEVLFGWLNDFVSNWADCDQLCCEVFGQFMIRYPEFYSETRKWALSDSRWLRRASAVILIPELRKTCTQLPLLFELTLQLLPDQDDLVQKGYGWALKVSTQVKEAETLAFVMKHRADFPRTALRYAVEKLTKEQRAAALNI